MNLVTFATENTATQAQEETFSQRLMHALHILKVSQSELARRIGVKPQVIQYLCTSDAKKSKFSYDIAFALDVSPDWLIGGKGVMRANPIPGQALAKEYIKVPLLTWDKVTEWIKHGKNFTVTDYAFTAVDVSSNAYAIKVMDSAMSPRFEIGSTLIIDPDLKPRINDFIIVSIEKSAPPILRQLTFKTGQYVLAAFNTKLYNAIDLTSEVTVLGVVRQANFEYSRN